MKLSSRAVISFTRSEMDIRTALRITTTFQCQTSNIKFIRVKHAHVHVGPDTGTCAGMEKHGESHWQSVPTPAAPLSVQPRHISAEFLTQQLGGLARKGCGAAQSQTTSCSLLDTIHTSLNVIIPHTFILSPPFRPLVDSFVPGYRRCWPSSQDKEILLFRIGSSTSRSFCA